MIATVLITFGIVLFVVLAMSIGVLLGRKPISEGSCCEGSNLKPECAGCERLEKDSRPPQCVKA
jgi:hypothetical protein